MQLRAAVEQHFDVDTLLDYPIDPIVTLEYDSHHPGEPMANSSKKEGIDWKWLITTVIVLIGLAAGTAWALHAEFAKLDERIGSLDKHIQKVEIAVKIVAAKQGGDTKTIIDEALSVAKNASDAGRTESAKAILEIANRLLTEQKASRGTAPQEFFDNAIKNYQKLQKSPELADSAWDGSTKLVEYRSAISQVPTGLEVHIGEMGQRGPFRYLKDSLISGPSAIAIGTEKGFVLDGFYLDNVVFQNANIIYHGGPVVLQNVRFVNCKFDVRKSSQSEQLLEAAIKELVNVAIG
jgi:hypothetical protein